MGSVLFIAHRFPQPSEGFLLRDLAWLAENGYEFTVLTGRIADRALWNAHGLPPDRLVEAPWLWCFPARALFGIARRAGLLALRHADYADGILAAAHGRGAGRVHALFGGLPALAAAVAAQRLGVPFSASVHAADVYTVRPAYLQVLAEADMLVACNSTVAEFVRARLGVRAPRIAVIRHVFEASDWQVREPAAGGYIAALGRFVEKKGFDVLISAMARLAQARLVLAGSGPLEARLREQARNSRGHIEFAGWLAGGLREMVANLGVPGVVAVPSVEPASGDREGIPNVLLEAWALRLPVVATRAGGITEVARDGENALLAPAGDVAALAGALNRVLADATLARRLGAAGRRTLEADFAPAATAGRLAKCLCV